MTSGRWAAPGQVDRTPDGVAAEQRAGRGLAGRAGEVVELRTGRSATYATVDGGFETVLSPGRVHFPRADGSWGRVDNRLVADSTGGLVNAANDYRLRLPGDLTGPVTVSLPGGGQVAFALQDAKASGRQVNGPSARYPDALDGVDVVWQARGDGVKELLVLSSPDAAGRFVYDVVLSPGLALRATASGDVQVVDLEGDTVAVMPAPFAFDGSHGTDDPTEQAFTDQVTFDVEQTLAGWRLTVAVDEGWLSAAERVWPVTVDPQMTLGAAADCMLTSGTSADVNQCGDDQLKIGYRPGDGKTNRALLDFDVTATFDSIAPGGPVVVAAAELGLYQNDTDSLDVSLHAIDGDWNRSCVSWNDADECAETPWATPGGDHTATPVEGAALGVDDTQAWSGDPDRLYWYPTALVQDWLDGDVTERGMLLKAVDETSGPEIRLASSEDTDSTRHPELKIRWYRGTGMRPSWTYETVQLNPAGGIDGGIDLKVNVANGNLMVVENDQTLAGVAGLDVELGRTYNWLATDGDNVGDKWRTVEFTTRLWAYGTRDRQQFQDPSGARVIFVRDPGDSTWTPTTETDLALTVNASGEYEVTRQGNGRTFVYTSGGVLDRIEDRNGNSITFTYNGSGDIASITDTRGRVFDFAYDASGNLDTITDPSGRIHDYSVDASADWLSSYTDPDNNTTSYVNNGWGHLDHMVDPDGAVTYFTYYGSSSSPYKPRIKTIERVYNASGARAVYGFDYYDDCSQADATLDAEPCTRVTNPDNDTVTYFADRSGRVTTTIDGLDRRRDSGYTVTGSTTTKSVTMPGGGQTSYTFDTLAPSRVREVSQTTDSAGTSSLTTTLNYDDPNNAYQPSRTVQPNGTAVDYSYDTTGRLSTVTPDDQGTGDPSATTNIDYTAVGQPDTVTNPLGGVTDYDYDTDHHLSAVTHPSGSSLGSESYTYDSMSRLTSHTDGNGQTTSYTYDVLDRLTKITYHDSSTVTFGYDRDNTREFMTDPNGTVDWGYNELAFLTRETLPDTTELRYGYDLDGVMSSYTTPDGRVQYEVDDANQLTSVTWPDGDPSAITIGYGYDDDGNRDHIAYPGGVTVDYTHGVDGRLQTIQATDANSNVLISRDYDYTDPTGDDTQLVHRMTDHNSHTVDYTYDTLNRLKTATASDSARSDFTYSYDAASNRTVSTVDGTSTYFAYNDANQLCWTAAASGACSSPPSGAVTYTFDGNGNLTGNSDGMSLSYNVRNQTTAITPAGGSQHTYSYQGPDQRRRASADNTDFQASILDTLKQDNGTTNTRFIRRPDATLAALDGSQGHRYPIVDRLGSVIALTDDTGSLTDTYTYTPYGQPETTTGTSTNPYRFVGNHGYYHDTNTGLHKIGHRYLNTANARWTQQDPTRQEPNLYNYTNCNPTNLIDPTGAGSCWAYTAASFLFGFTTVLLGVYTGGVGAVFFGSLGFAGEGAIWFDAAENDCLPGGYQSL